MQYASPAHVVCNLHSSMASIGAGGACGSLGCAMGSLAGAPGGLPASAFDAGCMPGAPGGCIAAGGVMSWADGGGCCAAAGMPAVPVFIGAGCTVAAGCSPPPHVW